MQALQVVIPCPHRDILIPDSEVAPDHHPLNWDDVVQLMSWARLSYDCQCINQIHVRLVQGIPGMECPSPIDGPVAEKLFELDELFVDALRFPSTDMCGLKEIHALMVA